MTTPNPDMARSLELAANATTPAPSAPVSAAPRVIKTPTGPQMPAGIRPPAKARVPEIKDEFEHQVALRLGFMGTGQGGGRMADSFYRLGYRRCAAFNLAEHDFHGLHESMLTHSLHLGGAAKDAMFAASQLQGREEELRDLFTEAWGQGVDCGIICAGLGGGTGSGTAPLLVELARDVLTRQGLPPRVGAIVSLPTAVEGAAVCRNAVLAFQRLVSIGTAPLIVVDNHRIDAIYKPAVSQLHRYANEQVSQLLDLFNQLASVHSEHWSFDRRELAETLDSGIVVLGAAEFAGDFSPASISSTMRERLTGNVLASVELKNAANAVCVFVAGQGILDAISTDYLQSGFAQVERMLATDGRLHRGLYTGSDESLQVYVAVGGTAPPRARLAELAKAGGMDATKPALASFLGVAD